MAGAVQAVAADPDLGVVLVGDQARVEPLVPADAAGRDRIEFFHCSQAIGMEESPVVALRKKPDNSISRCWQLLAQQKVDGIVSAGNTGAMVAGGLLPAPLPQERRAGPASPPSCRPSKARRVMIDVGANVSPKAEHLFQYGVMGGIFAKHILQRERPTIGLMNVGSEEAKGTDLAKETHALFNASPLAGPLHRQHRGPRHPARRGRRGRLRRLRRQRGAEDLRGRLRVRHEGAAQGIARRPWTWSATRRRRCCKSWIGRYDYSAYGGAPLLGIDGICIICHGSSGERAIKNALGRRRPVRAGRAERADRQGTGCGPGGGRAGSVSDRSLISYVELRSLTLPARPNSRSSVHATCFANISRPPCSLYWPHSGCRPPNPTSPTACSRSWTTTPWPGRSRSWPNKDKVLSLEAVGYADIAAKTPMQTDDLFWIASMSKAMTAAALMMLVDEGKVKLDDPVEKYLPEFKGQQVKATAVRLRSRSILSRSAIS